MTAPTDASGHAALAICESLLLALTETTVIDRHEGCGVLADAATTQRAAANAGDRVELHTAAADLVEAMLHRLDPTYAGR